MPAEAINRLKRPTLTPTLSPSSGGEGRVRGFDQWPILHVHTRISRISRNRKTSVVGCSKEVQGKTRKPEKIWDLLEEEPKRYRDEEDEWLGGGMYSSKSSNGASKSSAM